MFERFGEVGDVYIPRKFGSQEPRGFAFVRFLNERDAEDAVREMDGEHFDSLCPFLQLRIELDVSS